MSTSNSFNNSYFVPIMGTAGKDWKLKQLLFDASGGAIAAGSMIGPDSTAGYYDVADNTTTNLIGILAEPITTSDDDYTVDHYRAVYVPLTDGAECEFAVGAGTFTTADVPKSVKLNDELGVAVDTAGTQVRITGYISSSRGKCRINRAIA